MDDFVSFDREKRDRLRKRYEIAVANEEEAFTFENKVYLTVYAKYLLQYLDEVL